MNDTTTPAVTLEKQVARINVFSLFSDPAAWLSDVANKDTKELNVGNIVGVVDRINTRTNLDGTGVSKGLAGDFITQPSIADVKAERSNAFWPPSPIMQSMIALFENADKTKRVAPPIMIAFNVTLARAENDEGFQWRVRSLIPPATLATVDRISMVLAEVEKTAPKEAEKPEEKTKQTGAAPKGKNK